LFRALEMRASDFASDSLCSVPMRELFYLIASPSLPPSPKPVGEKQQFLLFLVPLRHGKAVR